MKTNLQNLQLQPVELPEAEKKNDNIIRFLM